MTEVNEEEVLAQIRTLLAFERNFLAEERTALAQFRSGLTLLFIGPTASTIFAVLLSVLSVNQMIILDILNIVIFSFLIFIGGWTIFRSQSKLNIIKKKIKIIKSRTIAISKSSKKASDLMCDFVDNNNLKKI